MQCILMRSQSESFCKSVCAHRADQRVEKAGAHTRADVTDGQNIAGGHTFLFSIMREREMGLGHTNGQIAETLQRKEMVKKYLNAFCL